VQKKCHVLFEWPLKLTDCYFVDSYLNKCYLSVYICIKYEFHKLDFIVLFPDGDRDDVVNHRRGSHSASGSR
jgi:hypothetical protein